MQKPEQKSRAEAAASGQNPHLEVKTVLSGFLSEFNSFQSEIKSKLKEQETQLAMLDRKSIAMSRPQLARGAETETPHKKAFAAYLRSGDDDGLRGLRVEEKALSTRSPVTAAISSIRRPPPRSSACCAPRPRSAPSPTW